MTESYAKTAPQGTPEAPPLTIRRAGPGDAEALVAIGRATFAETFGHLYPPEDLAAFLADAHGLARARADLADPAKAAWLVEAGGEVVGYALAGPCHLPHPEVTPACGELERLYLLAAHQGGGVGARLLGAALAWLEKDGPRRLWIGVWSENHGAQRLYARHGFTKVGEYEFVVGQTRDHEFILRRDPRPAALVGLEQALAAERPMIEASGVGVDGYASGGNEGLSWRYAFRSWWLAPPEIASVTVVAAWAQIVYASEASTELTLTVSAELFQRSRASRFNERWETRHSLAEVADHGLAALLEPQLERGREVLSRQLGRDLAFAERRPPNYG